jgi:ferrous iron transport protein A
MDNKSIRVEPNWTSDPCLLSSLTAGERCTLLGVRAESEALRRMASLGFTPGTEIEMIQNPKYGALIVSLRNIRVALGRGEAALITVRRYS